MTIPAIIAIGFTILAVPLFLKAAFAKPTPRQNLGAFENRTPGEPAAGSFQTVRADIEHSDAHSIWNPATDRWEIAMADWEEQRKEYYEDDHS